MATVTVSLPDQLVEQAEAAGLLKDERIAEWLTKELQRMRDRSEFKAELARLRAAEPKITPEDIDAELQAVRNEHTKPDSD